MAKAKKTYNELRTELDEVLLKLQQPDIDIEAAADLYEQGLKLATELRTAIAQTENRITKLSQAPAE